MNKKLVNSLIIFFTFASILPLLFVRLNGFQASIFWLYSALMTLFLIFMYTFTNQYKPMPDVGFRPNVSVIVPVKNEEAVIKETVNSILNSDYPKDKLKVIVVDDGSTDKTAEKVRMIKSERLIFVQHEVNRGKRRAFASGFKHADEDIVVCIDSDTRVDKDAIKLLVQPFIKDNVGAVCGHGYASNKDKNILTKLQHYWYQEMFLVVKSMEAKFGCVTCCSGILAAYRKDAIMPVMHEWLNERFFDRPILIGDDRQMTNLVLRGREMVSTRDSEVTYQSNAIAHTIVPDNFKQFWKQQLRWKRAWVHGTILASKFMWKKKFPIPLYWFIYQFLTYMNPVIIITWMVIIPLQTGAIIGTIAFLLSTIYIGFLHGLNIWKFDERQSTDCIFYRMMFVFVSMLMSIFLLPYAWATIHKGGWVTRGAK